MAPCLDSAKSPCRVRKLGAPLSRWRRVLRAARWLPLIVLVGLALVLANAWTALGHRAVGARRARMERSPQWKDGHFVNPQPLHNDYWGA